MLNIIYRLCENETDGNLRDIRPEWFDKIVCLQSFITSYNHANENGKVKSLTFVHDGPEGPLLEYLNKQPWNPHIVKVNHRDNLGSLLSTLDIADTLEGDIYFVEDDYLHMYNSIDRIATAVVKYGLVNGYDHPDRYIRDDDMQIDLKIVFDFESNIHWRTAESTCCTWAARSDVYQQIKNDVRSFGLWDRELFKTLHKKGFPLWTALPGITSQIDRNMSPGVDWKLLNDYFKLNNAFVIS